jgi:hypothetical protein
VHTITVEAFCPIKILEFADLDTSRVEPAYRKVVAAIANGDFRAAQVRKLVGAGHRKLYRARLVFASFDIMTTFAPSCWK